MENITNILSENIKTKRIEKGYSQDELSSLSGVERSQISRIEKGLVNPRAETIAQIASALELDVSELFTQQKKYRIHPFVKWAGGKTQLLDELVKQMPKKFNDYYEPFIGGGALLFKVQPQKAFINDLNGELLSVYKCLQSKKNFELLKKELEMHEKNHSEEYFMYIRGLDQSEEFKAMPLYKKAARMIYLNKACFNGIYRVNSSGYFNVPTGKKKAVVCYDRNTFDNLRSYFYDSDIKISHLDFEKAVAGAKAGDFVYFDPPYDDWDDKPTFKEYTPNSFTSNDQIRLFECFKALSDRGVYVMLSNNNTSLIRKLFKDFYIKVVPARRMINANGSGRGVVEEVIITNY